VKVSISMASGTNFRSWRGGLAFKQHIV